MNSAYRLSGSRRCCSAPARPRRHRRPRRRRRRLRHPPPTSNSKRWRGVTWANSRSSRRSTPPPSAIIASTIASTTSAPTAGRRSSAFTERYLAALAPIDRGRLSRANQVDALLLAHELEYQRWKLLTLEDWRWNPLIYTRLAGDALYSLLARDFAPEPERLRNLGKRLDELPRFLAQEREVLEPARVPKVHAETAVKQNVGLCRCWTVRSRNARHAAGLRPGVAARQRGARAQRDRRSTRSGWRSASCPKPTATFVWPEALRRKARVRAVLAAVAPGNPRARRSRARHDARGDVRRRAPGAQGPPRRTADCRKNPMPRNSSAPSARRSNSPTPSGPDAMWCSTRRAPR